MGLTTRVYYALGDFKTPVRISVVLLVVNVALNALFVIVLKMDTAGLALGTCLGVWAQFAWLAPMMQSRLGLGPPEAGGWGELGRVLLYLGTLLFLSFRCLMSGGKGIFALAPVLS